MRAACRPVVAGRPHTGWQAVFHHHLASRPVAAIDLARLARLADGFSGADVALVCESATEAALMDSVRTGEPRMITMADLERAAAGVRSSIGPWLETARDGRSRLEPV